MRKIITVAEIFVIAAIAVGTAYAGGPGAGDGCVWPTNPNGPCILDQLPSQPT
jgi:hypothetical protein